MSRRKRQFIKIKGAPQAGRVEKKPLLTYRSGCGGDVASAFSTLSGSNIRDSKGNIHVRPAADRKRELVQKWLEEPPKRRRQR